jgi:hypothetical protein
VPNSNVLLRPTTCRACGGLLDNDYVLMCMACVKGGVPIPEYGQGKGRITLSIADLREIVNDESIRRGAHALHFEYGPETETGWLQADSDVWAILKAVFVDA